MQRSVTIGLPSYNRPELLRLAVASLLGQTHRDLEIIISDNASPHPLMLSTLRDLAESDRRVRYFVNEKNAGPAANFRAVCRDVKTPYFMWASDDDIWDCHFVARCLGLLETTTNAQMAFGSIDNINNNGSVIRNYAGFSRFSSTNDICADALRFIAEPEILGKANIIYGLFRTPALTSVVSECWDKAGFEKWSGDCVLMYAFLSRHPIVATDEVLLHKRIITDCASTISIRDPRTYLVSPREFQSYAQRLKSVAPDPSAAAAVMNTCSRKIASQYAAALRSPAFWGNASHALSQRLSSGLQKKFLPR